MNQKRWTKKIIFVFKDLFIFPIQNYITKIWDLIFSYTNRYLIEKEKSILWNYTQFCLLSIFTLFFIQNNIIYTLIKQIKKNLISIQTTPKRRNSQTRHIFFFFSYFPIKLFKTHLLFIWFFYIISPTYIKNISLLSTKFL